MATRGAGGLLGMIERLLTEGSYAAFVRWSLLIALVLGFAVGTIMEQMEQTRRPSTLPFAARVYALHPRAGLTLGVRAALAPFAVLLVALAYALAFRFTR